MHTAAHSFVWGLYAPGAGCHLLLQVVLAPCGIVVYVDLWAIPVLLVRRPVTKLKFVKEVAKGTYTN